MPQRIAMVAYTHYTTDARPRRAAESLAARGDEVHFFALEEEGAPEHEVLRGVELHRLPAARYRGSSLFGYLQGYGRFFLQAATAVGKRHLKERYNVVYVHTMPDFMVFSAAFARLGGAKIVLDVHDTMPELYQSKFGISAEHPIIRALAVQEQLSCRFADRIICVHEPHKQLLVSRGLDERRITPILNLPDPSIFGVPLAGTDDPAVPPRLVYHGTVASRLGLDLALAAFSEVRRDFPTARFDIYGSGDAALQIIRLIDTLGLGESVFFSNKHFRVDAIPELLKGATLGVVPNRADPATRYMLPVKLLEYVYLGIPAVVPRLHAVQHYFDDDSVSYYEPGNVAQLATAMKDLLSSPERRQALRQNASRFTREYSWDAMKHDLFAVIDS